jgi:DNA-directed RNA polymerase subunit RPC12/RpoP
MENQITCPHCGRTISDNPLVESAATGEGQSTDFYVCECGERITFWAATAQLREQKRLSRRISSWFRRIFKGRD